MGICAFFQKKKVGIIYSLLLYKSVQRKGDKDQLHSSASEVPGSVLSAL